MKISVFSDPSSIRKYEIYFQIDDQLPCKIENVDFQTYIRLKYYNDEAYKFLLGLVNENLYPIYTPRWDVMYRSLDAIDYERINPDRDN